MGLPPSSIIIRSESPGCSVGFFPPCQEERNGLLSKTQDGLSSPPPPPPFLGAPMNRSNRRAPPTISA